MNMVPYIVRKIESAEDKNGTGAMIYSALFINISAYQRYRADVDTALTVDGYAQCIITD